MSGISFHPIRAKLAAHNVGMRLNRAVEFKQIDENYFDEED